MANEPILPYHHESIGVIVDTDISCGAAEHLAEFIVQVREQVSNLYMHAPRRRAQQEIHAWVLRDDGTYGDFTERRDKRRRHSFSGSRHGEVYVRGVSESIYTTRSRLLHELVHVFQWRANVEQLPDALRQGMCDLISFHIYDRTDLRLGVITGPGDEKCAGRMKNLTERRNDGGLSLRCSLTDPKANKGQGVAAGHLLMSSAHFRKPFEQYLAEIRCGREWNEAYETAMGEEAARLESLYRDHVDTILDMHRAGVVPPGLSVAVDQL